MSSPDDEVAGIAKKIVGLVASRKGENRPYLVSQLGLDLGEDLAKLKRLTQLGLNDFIQTRLSDQVTMVRMGAHGNVSALVEGTLDPNAIERVQASSRDHGPRFHYRFWAAFSVAPSGEVRVLNPDDFTFEDMPRSEVPEGALAISCDLIPSSDLPRRDEAIKANIASWLKDNGLSVDRFLAKPSPPKARQPSLPGNSLLDALVETLDRRQLQATSLSLDVILTLMQTPRR